MKTCSRLSIRRYIHKTGAAAFAICAVLTALLFLLSLSMGASKTGFESVVRWVSGGEIDARAYNILANVRLPRSVSALVCGAALALSGLLLQSALNNALVSANIIGVNSGAGFFVVLASVLYPGMFAAKPVFAFAGALGAAMAVFGIAKKAGASRSIIIMAGVAVSSLMSSGTEAIVSVRPESVMDKNAFYLGGFGHATMAPALYTLPFVLLGLAGAGFLASRMNVMSLGDKVAASLGVRVGLCRFLAILFASLLAASAVCIGGLLGFVGLIVPHGARFLVGHDNRRLVPFTAISGGALVLGCDILARMLFAPYELPVGILLSFLGAPFFLFLLLRKKRRLTE